MIIRMRLRAGAAIPGRLSTHPLCPRSPGTGPSEQSTTQQQRRTRLPPAAPTTKSPAQDGISIESHPRSSTEPHKTELSVWTAPITKGGGTRPTITVTPSAKADLGIAALEYSGLLPVPDATVVDQAAQATGTTSAAGTVHSGATAATGSANELALGFYVDSGWGDTLTAGAPFTSRINIPPASDFELLAEDEIVGQGVMPNAGVNTGANTIWLMSTVVFKHG